MFSFSTTNFPNALVRARRRRVVASCDGSNRASSASAESSRRFGQAQSTRRGQFSTRSRSPSTLLSGSRTIAGRLPSSRFRVTRSALIENRPRGRIGVAGHAAPTCHEPGPLSPVSRRSRVARRLNSPREQTAHRYAKRRRAPFGFRSETKKTKFQKRSVGDGVGPVGSVSSAPGQSGCSQRALVTESTGQSRVLH
jgi:hypothetical protein